MVIYTFEDDPGEASKKAKEWCVGPSLLAKGSPPFGDGYTTTCWYEYHGDIYIREEKGGIGFWKATAEDKAWLDLLRRIKRVDR